MSETLVDRVLLRIQVEMLRRGLTNTEVANRIGVSDMWVSRRLNGKTEMHVSDLEKLAAALDMAPDDLLERVA